jgi:CRISPR-associated protein Cas5d
MAYGVKLEVWGEYASFNRPEMKVERVSYEILTPSAARGILEAIYWKPQMRWIIDRIRVLAPIRFTHVRRNELDTTISAATVETAMRGRPTTLGISVEDHRKSLQHPEAKHLQTFKRRAATGQYFHHPYLGSREFPASFRLLADEELFPPCPAELQSERDLGFILWDIHFEADPNGAVVESHTGRRMRATPRFFHAHMRQGSVEVPPFAGTRG